ncbi:M20 family metallopeptidase [Paenibacillus gansuensis]|uniref:Peptidase M20 domain-containing protein 2 n=1 Tax=Paenibacillus gansuensis TaxID=306542 RepID=A0ABW5PFW0_9BACL
MKERISAFIESHRDEWISVSKQIWNNPELGNQEFEAMKLLTGLLEQYGFNVERKVAGLATAFRAEFDSGVPGPTIAYLAEYDALAGLGHACGHNIIGVMSSTAAIALKETGAVQAGKVVVFGTPAEETNGAKVPMAEQGFFDGVDAAMMAHPYKAYERSGSSMAIEALQFSYHGKSAHAAANPQDGINALDSVLQLFSSVNALRQHVTPDVRIHGIISHGGIAPNVVPDFAQAQFYVRAAEKATVRLVADKVRRAGEAAAAAMGCTLEISNYELSYDNMITNQTLSGLFTDNIIAMGVDPSEIQSGLDHGSLDLGNVSHIVPAVHPYVRVPDCPYDLHTHEFREAVGGDRGMSALLFGAAALARTGSDLFADPALLQAVQQEFVRHKAASSTTST